MLTINVNYSADPNIIYCKFKGDFNKNYKKTNTEEILYDSISKLSNGRFLPILINLEEVSFVNSIGIFKFLAHNQRIKSLILSQVFLVSSTRLKIFLSIYNLKNDLFVQNRICNDLDIAIYYCNKENSVFNALN